MEYKKSKWEMEYDKFNSEKETLKEKMLEIRREQASLKEGPEYAANKTELEAMKKTMNKYERIENNKEKIENVLNFKKELVNKTYKLIEEKSKIEKTEKRKQDLEAAIKWLDSTRQKNVNKVKEIREKLKVEGLKDDDRQKLETEMQKCLEAIQENDLQFSKYAGDRDTVNTYLQQYDKNKINTELLKNEQLMGKCDLIGSSLVKGKSMEDISANLDNFKFTPNKDFAKKVQAMRDMYSKETEKNGKDEIDNKVEEISKAVDERIKEEFPDNGIIEKEEKPVVISEFDQKHPTLAKIKNFFKHPIKSVQKMINKEEKEEKETVKTSEESKETNKEDKTNTNSDFEYAMKHLDGKDDNNVLKNIAEKGTSGFREDMKVDKQQQLEEMRRRKAQEYANKYGGRYAEQDGVEEER